MKRLLAAFSLATAIFPMSGSMAAAAQIAPISPGAAFYALPLSAWGGVVRNLYPAVQFQTLTNPQFLPLQSALGEINARLSENAPAGLQSMEFVRFMPKKYRETPEAFARLDEDKQIAGLSRGLRAASRALDGEALELTAKVSAGQASAEEVRRLTQIHINDFYLSPAVRRMTRIAALPPAAQGAIFDNTGRKGSALGDEAPAVVPAPEAESVQRPLRASKQGGGLMKNTGGNKMKDKIIAALSLQPLPGEGGYFKETYRSAISVPVPLKDGEPPVTRHLGTAIYYVVTPKEFSALHKVKSDEVFHFYGGDPVEMIQINEMGEIKTIILGSNILKGQQVQATVPAGTWQGTRLVRGGEYALLGTTVFPGFEFADFDLAKRADLTARFPRLAAHIKRFTRE